MWQKLCMVSVKFIFSHSEMMFDGHEDLFFFQTKTQFRRRRDSLGKSNKGQNLDQNINERRIV